MSASFSWDMLDQEVRHQLLAGSLGSLHLSSIAVSALNRSGQAIHGQTVAEQLFSLGRSLLLAAWEGDPLNGGLAGQLLSLKRFSTHMDGQLEKTLQTVVDNWRPAEDTRYFSRLLARRELLKIRRFLREQHEKDPGNLFWIRQALALALFEGDFDLAAEWVDYINLPALHSLREIERGHLHMYGGRFEKARRCYENSLQLLPLSGTKAALAASLRAMGLEPEAMIIWREVFIERPWEVNLVLTLHDFFAAKDKGRGTLPGQTAILLYSWNKADDLFNTLDSLSKSSLGHDFIIRVLNNGSNDHTSGVLRTFGERFGRSHFDSLNLPINVGAPAARNWLRGLPEVRASDFVVFLDDDVLLPPDWLEAMAYARLSYPHAGVWGCKVVDAANDTMLQSVDLHILDPSKTDEAVHSLLGRPLFRLSNLQHQVFDLGQFNYMRPCASVTGCCHMFSAQSLDASGEFDLRFSPSQYDDLEHDLRMLLNGLIPVYQGHLTVRHLKKTGKSAHSDERQWSNALANMYKLQQKYSAQEFLSMRLKNAAILAEDLAKKRIFVADRLNDNMPAKG